MYRRFLIAIIVSLAYFAASSQLAKQYAFTHFTVSTGLASTRINTMIQDSRGFIWLATINGLQRYDGKKFLTFRHNSEDPLSMPHDNIANLFLDRYNNMWVSTLDNKLGIFDPVSFVYKEIPIRWPSPPENFLGKQFIETEAGEILLYIPTVGFFQYRADNKEFVPEKKLITLPAKWWPHVVKKDPLDNKYWMAADSGLAVYDAVTKNVNYRGHNPDGNPIIKTYENLIDIFSVNLDRQNRFMLYTWMPNEGARVRYLDRKTFQHQTYNLSEEIGVPYHEVSVIMTQNNGRLWIGGHPFLAEFTGGPKAFQAIHNEYMDEQSIKFETVNNIFEDKEQNLWVITDNGVFLFNPSSQLFSSYNLVRTDGKPPMEASAISTVQLKNGDIWIGCWGTGIFFYDRNLNPIQPPPSMRELQHGFSVWSMHQHSKSGKLWMGYQGGGFIIYDPATKKAEEFKVPEFEGRTIRQIAEDKQGNLWFGSQGGHIIKWDMKVAAGDERKGYSLIKARDRKTVIRVFCDNEGYIWAGSAGGGVIKIDPSNNKIIREFTTQGPPSEKLFANTVSDILQYNDTTLLLASSVVTVLNTKTNKLSHITTQDGLPSNNVLCFQIDKRGAVWMGMVNGLVRMNLEKKIFTLYDRRDGIVYDNFNSAGSGSFNDGRVVFTTDRNFLVFEPEKIVRNITPPDAVVTDFRLANKSLKLDSLNSLGEIKLRYDNNSIIIEFGSLSYLRQSKIHYHYMLEGVDKEWQETTDNFAVYNYLPNGKFTFKVFAENADGIASTNITSIPIRVVPPFWKAWWFFALIILLICTVLYMLDKERVVRFNALQSVRSQIASNLHKDINTTLSNINLLSEIAKIKADKDITKSKEYIDQISEKSRRMIDSLDDMMWSIDPSNDSMEKTIARMKEFSEGVEKTHGLKINLQVERKVEKLKIDMKTRHELFLIFKDALNCLTQTFSARNAIITIDMEKGKLALKLQAGRLHADIERVNNCEYLADIHQRAERINAFLDIQNDRKTTSVILEVPVEA